MELAEETLQWEDMKSVFSEDLMDALLHNEPPTEGTLRIISAIRRNPEFLVAASIEKRKCIDREIKKLKEKSKRLSSTEKVRATINSACDIVSAPIRRVPLDVIREIAQFALDDHPSASPKSSPMKLARVCSSWRSAILSSPWLWSTLYFTVKAVDQDGIIESVRTVQNWFRRASGAPKKFFLYVDCKIPPGTPSYNFQLFLKAIGPSLSGLTCLAIGSRNLPRLMMQFADIEWNVSNLERLEIVGNLLSVASNDYFLEEMENLASVAERITLFKHAKLLTALASVQEMQAFKSSFAFLPWNQFTDISIHEASPPKRNLMEALKQLPQLRRLSLVCRNLHYNAGAIALVHENLESLTLHVSARSSAQECLKFFSSNCIFPKLKNLMISIRNMKTIELDNQMIAINSFPSLEVLILAEDIRIPTDLLICLLRGTPKLRYLSMHISDDDGRLTDLNKIFSTMTIKDGHCELLPCLTRFLFFGAADTKGMKFLLDSSVVSRCINSRFADLPEGCQPLTQAWFGGRFRFLTNLKDEVAHLSQGGNPVDILVSHTDKPLKITTTNAMEFRDLSMENLENVDHEYTLSPL